MQTKTNTRTYEWRGINRRGVNSTGRGTLTSAELAALVEEMFRKRYQWLQVEHEGIEVAGIVKHPDTERRVWWSEGPDYETPSAGRS